MAGLRAPTGGADRAPAPRRCDAKIAVWGYHLLDQRRQRHAVEGLARGQLGQLREDVAAALRLLAQQPHVVDVRRIRLDGALKLLGDHRNRGQRRAELVAAAAASPSSCERCCSRDSTSSVAATPRRAGGPLR